jgi:hypothetical protein
MDSGHHRFSSSSAECDRAVRHHHGFNAATTLICSKNSVQSHQVFSFSRCPALFGQKSQNSSLSILVRCPLVHTEQIQSIRTNAVAAFLAPALAAWSRCAEGGLLCSKLRVHPHTGPVFGAADGPQGNTTQQVLQQPPKRPDTAPRTRTTHYTPQRSAACLSKSAPRWPRRVARAADCSAGRYGVRTCSEL